MTAKSMTLKAVGSFATVVRVTKMFVPSRETRAERVAKKVLVLFATDADESSGIFSEFFTKFEKQLLAMCEERARILGKEWKVTLVPWYTQRGDMSRADSVGTSILRVTVMVQCSGFTHSRVWVDLAEDNYQNGDFSVGGVAIEAATRTYQKMMGEPAGKGAFVDILI